jgi:hypothetical protein
MSICPVSTLKQSLKLSVPVTGLNEITLGILSTTIMLGMSITTTRLGIGPTDIKDGMLILPPNVITEGKSPNLGIMIGGGVNSKGTIDGTGIFKSGNTGITGIGVEVAIGAGTGIRLFDSFGLGVALSTPETTLLQPWLLTVKTGSTTKLAG